MTFPALIFRGRDDDDLTDRLEGLRDNRDARRADAVVVADQNAIGRWLRSLLRLECREDTGQQQCNENDVGPVSRDHGGPAHLDRPG